jgi:hypothetical protein
MAHALARNSCVFKNHVDSGERHGARRYALFDTSAGEFRRGNASRCYISCQRYKCRS